MKLRPYQIEGRDFLASRRCALLADEMRVGKTPQAILAAHKVGAKTICVLCPAIAVTHWRREIARWWPDDRLPHAEVMSYEASAKYDLQNARWDVLIVDEAHYAKNPEAARTKRVYGKHGFGWHANRIWALSGTPAPRHAGELWPMLRAFGVVGMTYPEFTERFCYSDSAGRILGTRVDRIPELKALLDKIMLRRKRVDVAPDLPGITFNHLEVTPQKGPAHPEGAPEEPRALARWLEQNAAHLAEWRIAVATLKAPQLAEEIHGALQSALYDRTVVFGFHTEPLEYLASQLRVKGCRVDLLTGATPRAERDRMQDRLRAGETHVLVANLIAAGTAIDLSSADHGYFLEMSWVPGDNLQAANRLVALDKHRPVTYDVVTWPGSFDEKLHRVLTRRVSELNKLY